MKQQAAGHVFAAARPPEQACTRQDRTHRVSGTLLAINNDEERLGCGSQLGLSTLLFALPCPTLPTEACGLLSLLDHLMQVWFRGQAADIGGQGNREGLTAETRV